MRTVNCFLFFHCVDPVPNWDNRSKSTLLLNKDQIWIQIHNTAGPSIIFLDLVPDQRYVRLGYKYIPVGFSIYCTVPYSRIWIQEKSAIFTKFRCNVK